MIKILLQKTLNHVLILFMSYKKSIVGLTNFLKKQCYDSLIIKVVDIYFL